MGLYVRSDPEFLEQEITELRAHNEVLLKACWRFRRAVIKRGWARGLPYIDRAIHYVYPEDPQ